MSSFQHLDLAIDELELAAIQYADARRMAEFNAWPERYIKRIELLRRATANLRMQMIQEMATSAQEELEFA
jgi:hypothetical protein